MAFVVVYDACVLYPSTTRDLLIRLAQAGLVQARWTESILDETFRAVRRTRPDITELQVRRTRTLMIAAVRDCLVVGHKALIDSLSLPDPDDRHVLAAAIRSRAQVIVTDNIKDFPAEATEPWDVEARTADQFVVDQIHLDEAIVYGEIQRIADSWRNPSGTVVDVLHRLEQSGLHQAVALLRG
jgi:predicted nucleic acid-binding protein